MVFRVTTTEADFQKLIEEKQNKIFTEKNSPNSVLENLLADLSNKIGICLNYFLLAKILLSYNKFIDTIEYHEIDDFEEYLDVCGKLPPSIMKFTVPQRSK